MRHIAKDPPPPVFAEWVQENLEHVQTGVFNWDSLPTEIKQVVHASLLSEQGYICCYCGNSVERATSHIEHLRPRSRFVGAWIFDYRENLMASCDGGAGGNNVDSELLHCGHKKADWYDSLRTVSPLAKDCESFFKYSLLGEIITSPEAPSGPAAKKTIERLNLNSARLRRLREEAIEGALELSRLGEATPVDIIVEQLTRIEQDYAEKKEGRYEKFCMAVVDVARQFLREYGNGE